MVDLARGDEVCKASIKAFWTLAVLLIISYNLGDVALSLTCKKKALYPCIQPHLP